MTQDTLVPNTFSPMVLEYVDIKMLQAYERQLRRHTADKIRRLAKFIETSGIIIPLVVDKEGFVILGNARLAALKHLGLDSIPVIRVTHLDETMIRALILADNQFTLNAEWYKEVLREELTYLAPLVTEIGLELVDLGFETPQLDMIVGEQDAVGPDELLAADNTPPITQKGQIWLMNQHRLACGDAREEGVYIALMGDERAEMIFGDLPYNVPISGHVCGNGAIQHPEFVMGAGEMSPDQFIAFMTSIFTMLRKFSTDGSVHMQCMDWRHSLEILTAARNAGYTYLNMACWVKHTGGMGSFYRSQHELVHIFRSGAGKHINNIMLGKFGRNRTNVWEYDGANSFKANRKGDLALHSTTKPVDMVAEAIKDCSNRNGLVLDPCGGGGTTLIAAERTGRIARLIELDPRYCDVIVRRWQQCTGRRAVLATTGQAFNDLSTPAEAA